MIKTILTATALAMMIHSDSVLAQPDFVEDAPNKEISKIMLFAGGTEFIDFHNNLIDEIGLDKVTVICGSDVDCSTYREGVTLINHKSITGWAQDRIVRFNDGSYTTVYSKHIVDSTYSQAEVGLDINDGKGGSPDRNELVNEKSYYVEDGNVTAWDMLKGDGGDRIVTENYFFISQEVYEQNNPELIEEVAAGRKVIKVDAELSWERYVFHIDMYLLPLEVNGQLHVIFSDDGSKRAAQVKQQLLDQGVDIIKSVPMVRGDQTYFITNDLGTTFPTEKSIGYTTVNGFFNGTTWYAADFDAFDVTPAKTAMNKVMAEYGFDVVYIEGGEDIGYLGGFLRCATAVWYK